MIKGFDWLSASDKEAIFHQNATRLFGLEGILANRSANAGKHLHGPGGSHG